MKTERELLESLTDAITIAALTEDEKEHAFALDHEMTRMVKRLKELGYTITPVKS